MTTETVITLVIAIIGAVTGIAGMILGILGYMRDISHDRLVVRVGTTWGLSSQDPANPFLAIHVTNLSKFPVTIREAGVMTKENRLIDGSILRGQLPKTLEPRTKVTVTFSPDYLLRVPATDTTPIAYVLTDCGEQISPKENDIPSMMKEAHSWAADPLRK